MDFAALRISAMAPRVVPLLRIIMTAIGGEPDMRHYLALVEGGAIDAVDGAHSAASRCHRVVTSKRTT
jgi:hypothetical protein